jgi:hypothetical protein
MMRLEQIRRVHEITSKIKQLKEAESKESFPYTTTLPEGYFQRGQLERFQNIDSLIKKNADELMFNIGIEYSLAKYFKKSPDLFSARSTHYKFDLILPNSSNSCGCEKPDTSSYFIADLEKNPSKDSLSICGQYILVPGKKPDSTHIFIEDAYQYLSMQEEDGNHFKLIYAPYLQLRSISEDGIKKLLTLVICDPKYSAFLPKNMDFQKEQFLQT